MAINALIGNLIYKITGDQSALDKSLDTSTKKIEQTAAKMQKLGSKLTKFVTVPIVGIGTAFVKLASDAEETNSKFEAVFKDQSESVREWAEDFSDAVGRSTTENVGFLATIQDTLVPLGLARDAAADMSTQVVELATDLSSFNNLPTEQVVRDIQSALVGNTETVRKYGVVASQAAIVQEAMNTGLIENEKELDATTKAQAVYQLLVKGTADAQGDALRTQDSFANTTRALGSAMKDLGESFGAVIIPQIKGFVTQITDLANRFTDLSPKTKEVIVDLAKVAAIMGPALIVIPKAVSAFRSLFTVFTVGTGPIGLIATAIAGVIAGLTILSRRVRDAKEEQQFLDEAIAGNLSSVEDYEQALEILNERNEKANKLYTENQKVIETTEQEVAALTKAYALLEDGITRNEEATVKHYLTLAGKEDLYKRLIAGEIDFIDLQTAVRLSLDNARQSFAATNEVADIYAENQRTRAAIEANLEAAITARKQAEEDLQKALEAEIKNQEELSQKLAEKLAAEEKERIEKEKLAQIEQTRIDVEQQYSDLVFEQSASRIEILERERDQRIQNAQEIGAATADIETYYANLIEAERNQAIQSREAFEKQYADLVIEQSASRIDQINREKNLRLQYAEEIGAGTADIETYYANLITEELEASERDRIDAMNAHTIEALKLKAHEREIDRQTFEEYERLIEARKAAYLSYVDTVLGGLSSIFGALQQLSTSRSNAEVQRIEEELQQRLDALDEELLGEEAYAEEVERITRELEQEKAQIEYEAALQAWRYELFAAIASGAQAILNGFKTSPFVPAGLIAGALATALTGIQIATIREQKPTPPSFESGADFIVPPGYEDDSFPFQAKSGERVVVTPAEDTSGTQNPVHVTVYLGSRLLYDEISKATDNGEIIINPRSVRGA